MSWGEIKKAINSTLGTSISKSLDEWLKYRGGDFIFEYSSRGTFSLAVPSWATIAIITACGGGGGGGNGGSDDYGFYNGGGGSGGTAIINKIYSVTGGSTISITVGGGGPVGRNGESTIIGNLVTLVGGKSGGNGSTAQGKGGASAGTGSGAGGNGNAYGSAGLSGGGSSTDGGGGGSISTPSGLSRGKGGDGGIGTAISQVGNAGTSGYVRIVFK